MKKPLITALLLLATSAAAQAAVPDCNPATGNWVDAAPTTCRFIVKDNDKITTEPRALIIRETPRETPTDNLPELY